jgi:two-component system response regulator
MNDQNVVDIMLVEDNPHDAEMTIRALKKHGLANRLIHLEDGAQAMDFLFGRGQYESRVNAASPKVVFLDLKLPKVNGLEILKAIRADERTRTIPVVMVTSSAEDPDITAAYDLGANSYVVKPVEFESFMETMRTLGFYWLVVNHPNGG